MGKKRSKIDIVNAIFEAIKNGEKNPTNIKNEIGLHNASLKEYVALIQSIQSLPKLKVTRLGKYKEISIEEESEYHTSISPKSTFPAPKKSNKKNKANTQKNQEPIMVEDSYMTELIEIWKQEKGYPNFYDRISKLRALPALDVKKIKELCEGIFGDNVFNKDAIKFGERVQKTIEAIQERLADEEFENQSRNK